MKHLGIVAAVLFLVAPAAAQDMPLSQILIDGEGWKLGSKDFKAITGLATGRTGDVYILDAGKGVVRLDRDGKVSGTMAPKTTTVMAVGPSPTVPGQEALFCGFPRDGKAVLDVLTTADSADKGVVQNLGQDIAAHALIVARDGTIYFTVPEEHAVYALSPKGEKRKVAENVGKPTGLAFWRKGGTLVVADAAGKYLNTFRVEKDGSLSDREGYYTLRLPRGQRASGAGGLTEDDAGRLYAASPVGVQIFDPTGRMCGVLLNPPSESPPTAVAFGGATGDLLYVACGDKLFVRKTKAKGVGLAEKPK